MEACRLRQGGEGPSYLMRGTVPVMAAMAMKITKMPMAHLADSLCHSPISRPVRLSSR